MMMFSGSNLRWIGFFFAILVLFRYWFSGFDEIVCDRPCQIKYSLVDYDVVSGSVNDELELLLCDLGLFRCWFSIRDFLRKNKESNTRFSDLIIYVGDLWIYISGQILRWLLDVRFSINTIFSSDALWVSYGIDFFPISLQLCFWLIQFLNRCTILEETLRYWPSFVLRWSVSNNDKIWEFTAQYWFGKILKFRLFAVSLCIGLSRCKVSTWWDYSPLHIFIKYLDRLQLYIKCKYYSLQLFANGLSKIKTRWPLIISYTKTLYKHLSYSVANYVAVNSFCYGNYFRYWNPTFAVLVWQLATKTIHIFFSFLIFCFLKSFIMHLFFNKFIPWKYLVVLWYFVLLVENGFHCKCFLMNF